MLPTATEPKGTDAGDREMAAPPVELVLDGFGAPEIPMQPEIESSPASKRSMEARRAMLVIVEISRAADFAAPPQVSRMGVFFNPMIVG